MSAPTSPQIAPAAETRYIPLTIDELSQLLHYENYGQRAFEILRDDDAKMNLLRHFDTVMGTVCLQRRILKEDQGRATTLLTELWSSGVEAALGPLIDEFRAPTLPAQDAPDF